MAERVSLNGAVGPTSGFYFLLVDGGYEDDESVLAVGRRVGESVEIQPLSDAQEFVSIDTMPGTGFGGALVCALTADGTLMFSDGVESWSEVVVRDPPRRLRTVRFVDGVLYVAGFGGQVYRRRDDEPWDDISFDVPELVSGYALFYHVVAGPDGTPLFGGTFLHQRKITDAMKAALDAGDGKLFRKLKRASKQPDHMLVAEYRDGWRVRFTEEIGVVSWLWHDGSGDFHLASGTGDVWLTQQFQFLEPLVAPDDAAAFDDIEVHDGEPLFLRGGKLFRLGGSGLVAFEPTLPDAATSVMGLWGGEEGVIAVGSDAIWSLDGSTWERLGLRLALNYSSSSH